MPMVGNIGVHKTVDLVSRSYWESIGGHNFAISIVTMKFIYLGKLVDWVVFVTSRVFLDIRYSHDTRSTTFTTMVMHRHAGMSTNKILDR